MGELSPENSTEAPVDNGKVPRAKYILEDFEIQRRLGEGSYSEVIQVVLRSTQKVFALKIVDKHLILRNQQVEAVKQERALLERLQHPGIVRLYFTFQDTSSLYFGLECCPNGDLFDEIHRQNGIPLEASQMYAAEIVEILCYLQQNHVVHRDLKPENLLLDELGHLKLTDFGSAKVLGLDPSTAPSTTPKTDLVGTADYSSPEALKGHTVGTEADLWALGCILFHMLAGVPPFKAASEFLTFQRIADLDFHVPDDLPPDAADLIHALLQEEPQSRLGAGDSGFSALRAHKFFEGLDWKDLWSQKAPTFKDKSRTLDEDGISWALQSLAIDRQPLKIEYDHCVPHTT